MSAITDISKLDFKGLREYVIELESRLVKLKRVYDDALMNIDASNFSESILRERDNMYASLKISEEAVSSVLSKLSDTGEELSVIKQTASAIETEVASVLSDNKSIRTKISQTAAGISALAERIEDSEKSISEITQTADEIILEVSDITGDIEELTGKITQTADEIRLEVSLITGDIESLTSKIIQTSGEIKSVISWNFSDAVKVDNFSGVSQPDCDKVYFDTGDKLYYYYYKDSWHASDKPGVESFFIQEADGFSLSGDVLIKGNVISDGTICGSSFYDADMVQKIDLSASGDDGAFRIYNTSYYPTEASAVPYFSVCDGSLGNISLMCYAESFLGVKISGGPRVTPYGEWDFSGATVTGLDSCIAVFG